MKADRMQAHELIKDAFVLRHAALHAGGTLARGA